MNKRLSLLFLACTVFLSKGHTSAPDTPVDGRPAYSMNQTAPVYTQGNVNAIVARSAKRSYGHINANWSYPTNERTINPGDDMFSIRMVDREPVINGKVVRVTSPMLVFSGKAHELSDALNRLITAPSVLECTIALKIVKIIAVRDILGEAHFTSYAQSIMDHVKKPHMLIHTLSWSMYEDAPNVPVAACTSLEAYIKRLHQPGHVVYLSNLTYYPHFKPNQASQGFNTVCVGPNKYVSFDNVFAQGPQSFEDVRQHNKREFMCPDDVEQEHGHHARICDVIAAEAGRFENEYGTAQLNQPRYMLSATKLNTFLSGMIV